MKRPRGRAVSAPDGVAGSNPAGGEILPEPERRFIAQSLSCSPFHRLEMTEILLKGRKTLTHPTPGFPHFLLYVRCKSGVTFIRRSFRDDFSMQNPYSNTFLNVKFSRRWLFVKHKLSNILHRIHILKAYNCIRNCFGIFRSGCYE